MKRERASEGELYDDVRTKSALISIGRANFLPSLASLTSFRSVHIWFCTFFCRRSSVNGTMFLLYVLAIVACINTSSANISQSSRQSITPPIYYATGVSVQHKSNLFRLSLAFACKRNRFTLNESVYDCARGEAHHGLGRFRRLRCRCSLFFGRHLFS